MQDRFKYKVYDEDFKKCFDAILIDQERAVVEWYNENGRKRSAFISEVIVVQCTGLKDKNGKLIFEGDIVKVTASRDTSGYGEVVYHQAGCTYVICGFKENPCVLYPRRKGEFFLHLEQWLCTEIIGNIYENPELLEVKNVNIQP